MSKLDELKSLEKGLEDAATSGNTIAAGISAHLLAVIGAISEIATAQGVDLSPVNAKFDSVGNVLDAMNKALSALSGRVAMIENAFSVAQATQPAQAASPAPAAPADGAANVQPTV